MLEGKKPVIDGKTAYALVVENLSKVDYKKIVSRFPNESFLFIDGIRNVLLLPGNYIFIESEKTGEIKKIIGEPLFECDWLSPRSEIDIVENDELPQNAVAELLSYSEKLKKEFPLGFGSK